MGQAWVLEYRQPLNRLVYNKVAYHRDRVVALAQSFGFSPGSYVMSFLLVQKKSPPKGDLLRAANVSGGLAPIVVPVDNWFSAALTKGALYP